MKKCSMILKEELFLSKESSLDIKHLSKPPVYRQMSTSRTICYMILTTHSKKCSLKNKLIDKSIMILWLISNLKVKGKD